MNASKRRQRAKRIRVAGARQREQLQEQKWRRVALGRLAELLDEYDAAEVSGAFAGAEGESFGSGGAGGKPAGVVR
jgi:acetyl-CoA carboxylase carboxyltransferase component